MKQASMVIGSFLLLALLASPALAHGPGWGGGSWGMGPGYSWGSGFRGYEEQTGSKLSALWQTFWNENASTRSMLWAKRAELRALLSAPQPDAEKARALQKEISDLNSQLAGKRLETALEARKIAPQGALGPGGFGRGFGGRMRGWGRHMGGWDGPMAGAWERRGGAGFGRGMGYGPGFMRPGAGACIY